MMGKEKELEDYDLISQVRMRGFKPSQIYKSNEIMEDDGFQKAIEDEVDYRIYLKEQEGKEELNEQMRQEIEEEKLKESENELIPDSGYSDEGEKEKEQKKKKKKSSDDNPLIPDDSDEGEENGNELIPE